MLKVIFRLSVDIRVVFIQPMLLSSRQERLVNQSAAVGDHGYVFEAEIWLVPELVLGFSFSNHDDVFDADSETAVFVVTWLVGNYISWSQRDFGELDSGADADGSFMDVQIGANAVTGTVSIV